MATIRIPPALRATVGDRQVSVPGDTVGAALRKLATDHPAVKDQLFNGDGALQRYVNVYLNQQDIQYLDRLNTPVSDDDTIIIMPAMAGGSLAEPYSYIAVQPPGASLHPGN